MRYDDIITTLGEFGLYQKRIYALLCITAISISAHTFITNFLLAIPDHRCAIPGVSNDTYLPQSQSHDQIINLTIPSNKDGKYSQCHYKFTPSGVGKIDAVVSSERKQTGRSYTISRKNNELNITNNILVLNNSSSDENTAKIVEKTCSRRVYDTTNLENSLTTKFDLVCDRKLSVSHAKSVFMWGALCGSLFLGPPADLLGRKKLMMFSITLHIIASFAIAFTPSLLYLYTFLFINGFAVTALYIIIFVIGVELVGPGARRYAGFIVVIFYGLGIAAVAGVAYFIRNWQTLQLVMSCVPVPFLLYFWFIPESPRWLISRERFTEAEGILRKAANVNNRILPDKALEWREFEGDISVSEPFWHIIRYPRLIVRTVIIFIDWLVCSMAYFGIVMNVGDLAGSIYLNCLLFGLVEIASYMLCIYFLDRVGRRRLFLALIFLAGIACATSPLPVIYGGKELQLITVILAMIGRFGIAGAYATMWVYSSEVFPTVIRNTGVSTASVFARIGGIIAPYIPHLTDIVGGKIGKLLPLVIFGGLSLLIGLLSLMLPETRHTKLPDTLKEADQFGRNENTSIEEELEERTPLDNSKEDCCRSKSI